MKSKKVKCVNCAGQGKVVGLGFTLNTCFECDGNGYVIQERELSLDDVKETQAYDDALSAMKAADPALSHAEAAALFKQEFDKSDLRQKKQRKSSARES